MRPPALTRRTLGVRLRAWVLGASVLGAAVVGGWLTQSAFAQEVAPRLTGSMVVSELGKVQQALAARAKSAPDPQLDAVAGKLTGMRDALQKILGGDVEQPTETLGAGERDAVVRADAAAKRVTAWLDASAVACTREDLDAMLAALSATLEQLASDTSSQKAPLPIIDGVETIDKRPLFVLRPGTDSPRFVLTGANLVDPRCANPVVVAVDAKGKPVAVQPQLVAAQPTRVELRWAGADKLAPGSYTLQLTPERKAFLVGCVSEPPAMTALQIAPLQKFQVSYALVATCQGSTGPVSLGAGTLTLEQRGQTAVRNVDVTACANPISYTVTAAVRTAGSAAATKLAPVTQGADASILTGLGNGLTLSWEPALHQLFVRSGKQGCKGVY